MKAILKQLYARYGDGQGNVGIALMHKDVWDAVERGKYLRTTPIPSWTRVVGFVTGTLTLTECLTASFKPFAKDVTPKRRGRKTRKGAKLTDYEVGSGDPI